jgi:hypothetical protein
MDSTNILDSVHRKYLLSISSSGVFILFDTCVMLSSDRWYICEQSIQSACWPITNSKEHHKLRKKLKELAKLWYIFPEGFVSMESWLERN